MVPFKSCFMHYPQIPNFYLANLEMHPFLRNLTGPLSLGAALNQKVEKNNMFLEFAFVWGPFYKNTPILNLIFTPLGPRGTTGALRVCRIKKLHKTKSDRRLILGGVPFNENVEIQKFWLPPQPAPPASPAFQPCFLGQWAKN